MCQLCQGSKLLRRFCQHRNSRRFFADLRIFLPKSLHEIPRPHGAGEDGLDGLVFPGAQFEDEHALEAIPPELGDDPGPVDAAVSRDEVGKRPKIIPSVSVALGGRSAGG